MFKPVELKYVGMRKISNTSSSLVITLPREIVEALKLERGERLLFYLTSDGRVVLTPEHRRELWEVEEGKGDNNE